MAFPQSSPGQPTGRTSIASTETTGETPPKPAATRAAGRRSPPIAFPPAPAATPTPTPLTAKGLEDLFFPRELPIETSSVLALVYSGSRRSVVDPCGCVQKQLGGIMKEARLVEELNQRKVPALKLDAGGFLKVMISDPDVERGQTLMTALHMMGYQALNVGYPDLWVGSAKLKQMAQAAKVKLISANIRDSAGDLLFEPYTIETVALRSGEQVRVGIIGLSRPNGATPGMRAPNPGDESGDSAARDGDSPDWSTGSTSHTTQLRRPADERSGDRAIGASQLSAKGKETYKYDEPSTALKKYLPELKEKSDIIVLLIYARRDQATGYISALGNAADNIQVAVAAEFAGNQTALTRAGKTILVSGAWEGKNIGNLLLDIADAKIRRSDQKWIEVEQSIPSVPEYEKLVTDFKASQVPPGVNGAAGAPASHP